MPKKTVKLDNGREVNLSESVVQQLVFKHLRAQEDPIYKNIYAVPNQGVGGKKGMMHTQLMRAEGLSKGALDINVDVARKGFHGMRIELKYGDNVPSPQQIKAAERHTEQGYLAMFINTDDYMEVVNAIDAYLFG